MSLDNFDWSQVDSVISSHTEYLLKSQREDGGWGLQRESLLSSPQNTGEALSALLKKTDLTDEEENAIERGIRFLIDNQCQDGGWPRAKRSPSGDFQGQIIATSWAIQALFKSLGLYEKYERFDPKFKETIVDKIKKAQNFVLDAKFNRKIKGSWSEYRGKKSSVTATCCAILALLASKSSNPDLEQQIETASKQGLDWLLNSSLNSDGGIGFFRNDISRCPTTILLMFTAAYAYRKGINPVEFTRVVQWVQFKFESPVDNELCVPDVEYSDYGTVLEDYQHFSTARIVYLIYKDYIEELILKNSVNKFNFDEKRQEINSWREQYLSKLLTLKRPLGGSLIEPHSRLYTWATAQALLALITARNWHKLNSIETLDIKSIPKISVPVVKVADKFVSKILHISDLHFTAEAKTKVWYNQLENEVKENINLKQSHGLAEKWFNQLDQDIKNNLNCQTIDILIISGDIADKSTPEEYVAAKIFIEKVCDNFQIGTKQRVIVPGNHDLNWEISEKAFHLVRRKNYRGEIRPEIDIDRGSDVVEIRSEEIYLQRFEHFQRFYKNITESDYPENYDEQGIIHYFPDSKLLILGLNSAWNQDHHYKERAGINTLTLAKVLPLIRGNPEYTDCLKIAVWHHPVTGQEMMDYEFMDLLANDGFQVCLHGHIHQAIEDFRKYDDNRGLHIIGAGTFGAPTKQQVSGIPLQYNLLVLDPQNQQITVNTRKKEKIDGSWSADARWGDKNNPSPRYTIEYDSRKKTDESSSQPQLTSADSSAVNPPNSQQDILSHVTVYGNLTVGDINQISGDSR